MCALRTDLAAIPDFPVPLAPASTQSKENRENIEEAFEDEH